MKIRTYPLAISLVVAGMATVLVTGCNRSDMAQADSTASSTVKSVENGVTDTVVTTKVKTALLKNQDTKNLDVHVETHQGIVQLTGSVDNQAQSDTALVVARAVEGVRSVENNITAKAAS